MLVTLMGSLLVIYGIYYLRKTGKLMGVGFAIIGAFVIQLAWWSFGDYSDAIGERIDRIVGTR